MTSPSSSRVPSPADAPRQTARQLLREVKRRGGRVYRMRLVGVFVLTQDPELARWLLDQGGRTYLPRGLRPSWDTPLGAYRRAPEGPPEWDIYIHTIPVKGEQSIWESAGETSPTVEATDFA